MNKKNLIELISHARLYLSSELLQSSNNFCGVMDTYAMSIQGETNIDYQVIESLLLCILTVKPNIENEQIYEILKILGWEVVDE